ncbi:uncharacterized protein PHALS_01276 [Plasmopara halstedii]|uniref:Uncharacterized protein n=1 Tax=Plasmopara halstedii TaxID=4781 RepID=A0A0P1AUF6_PLAHL|nr:uncharacterized protein PHALS_01276 [Plasmopara halstedii]CEG44953.1 hypothetical protein PHALS_01276 [Plasmopara halstedii]|eukprot:XP_024581322.1 hypothetical protein PHALS_01276 [Plasmopara halstedii]
MQNYIDNYRNTLCSRFIDEFNGFDFVGEFIRLVLPGDNDSVYRDRALTTINDSIDKLGGLETIKSEVNLLQRLYKNTSIRRQFRIHHHQIQGLLPNVGIRLQLFSVNCNCIHVDCVIARVYTL